MTRKIVQFTCGCVGMAIFGGLGWWLGGMIGPQLNIATGLFGAVFGFWIGQRG